MRFDTHTTHASLKSGYKISLRYHVVKIFKVRLKDVLYSDFRHVFCEYRLFGLQRVQLSHYLFYIIICSIYYQFFSLNAINLNAAVSTLPGDR